MSSSRMLVWFLIFSCCLVLPHLLFMTCCLAMEDPGLEPTKLSSRTSHFLLQMFVIVTAHWLTRSYSNHRIAATVCISISGNYKWRCISITSIILPLAFEGHLFSRTVIFCMKNFLCKSGSGYQKQELFSCRHFQILD